MELLIVGYIMLPAFAHHRAAPFRSIANRWTVNTTVHAHGFERSAIGDAIGGSYTHNLLIRGKPDMCRFMVRTKNKKKMRRRSSSSMLTSSCYIEKATRCSLMRQCSEPTGGPGRRQSIITTRSSNNYSLPSTSSSSTGPVSSSRFRSLGGSQNFRRTEENFANERFPKFPNFDNLPTSASSRNSSSRNLGPFKSPSSRTDEVMGWLPSPFGGTEMTSRLPSPPPSLNENNRSRHSSSKSMPAALTRFANSGPTSDEMFGGLDRDRDRVEESPIAGGQNCHLVRTLEASLSVLNMATQQQQPRVF